MAQFFYTSQSPKSKFHSSSFSSSFESTDSSLSWISALTISWILHITKIILIAFVNWYWDSISSNHVKNVSIDFFDEIDNPFHSIFLRHLEFLQIVHTMDNIFPLVDLTNQREVLQDSWGFDRNFWYLHCHEYAFYRVSEETHLWRSIIVSLIILLSSYNLVLDDLLGNRKSKDFVVYKKTCMIDESWVNSFLYNRVRIYSPVALSFTWSPLSSSTRE